MNLLRGSVHELTFSNMHLQFMKLIKYFYIHCHLFKENNYTIIHTLSYIIEVTKHVFEDVCPPFRKYAAQIGRGGEGGFHFFGPIIFNYFIGPLNSTFKVDFDKYFVRQID